MIPEMTDPLGRYWRQPVDIRDAPMDERDVLLTQRQLAELSEYSSSVPSGAYEGKCWKWYEYEIVKGDIRTFQQKTGRMQLRWYGPSDKPGYVSINTRWILLTD